VMYLPPEFAVADPALLHQLMERFSFAMLVSVEGGLPLVTHLPLLLDGAAGEHGRLLGHVARANKQWKAFDGRTEALAVFRGDHGYVSPSWYETHPSVPTWNYLVVHAHGAPRLIEDDAGKRQVLRQLVAKYEGGFESPWPMDLPEPYFQSMLAQIVAFEMPITRLEGKFKLNQNRPGADQERVVERLAASADPADQALARAMREALAIPG
jgi:transcriptional regulator